MRDRFSFSQIYHFFLHKMTQTILGLDIILSFSNQIHRWENQTKFDGIILFKFLLLDNSIMKFQLHWKGTLQINSQFKHCMRCSFRNCLAVYTLSIFVFKLCSSWTLMLPGSSRISLVLVELISFVYFSLQQKNIRAWILQTWRWCKVAHLKFLEIFIFINFPRLKVSRNSEISLDEITCDQFSFNRIAYCTTPFYPTSESFL